MSVLRQVRWKTVRKKARECLKHSNGFPVDLDAIAKNLQIDVKRMKFEDQTVSGVIGYDESKVVIGINRDHSEARQRFTLAHEIGHFVLHPASMVVDRALYRNSSSSEAISAEEIEANGFAAELLMPADDVREQVSGIPAIDEPQIRALRDRYGVSEFAVTVRLTSLGLLM